MNTDLLDKYRYLFNLDPDFGPADLRQAYRDHLFVWRPDRFSTNDRLRKLAEKRTKEVVTAFEYLHVFLEEQNRGLSDPIPEAKETLRPVESRVRWPKSSRRRTEPRKKGTRKSSRRRTRSFLPGSLSKRKNQTQSRRGRRHEELNQVIMAICLLALLFTVFFVVIFHLTK